MGSVEVRAFREGCPAVSGLERRVTNWSLTPPTPLTPLTPPPCRAAEWPRDCPMTVSQRHGYRHKSNTYAP